MDKSYLFYTHESAINKAFLYLLGFQPDYGLILLSDYRITIFLDSRYYDMHTSLDYGQVKSRLQNPDIKIDFVLLDKDYSSKLQQLVPSNKVYLEKSVQYYFYEKIKNFGFEIDFVDDYFADFRMRKYADEKQYMQKAISIMDSVFAEIENLISSGQIIGKSEKQIRTFIINKIFEFGGQGESFDSIVAFGIGSSIPHYQTGDVIIQDGGVLLIDSGAVYHGYCSDFTRTYWIGNHNSDYPNFQKIYNIVYTAYDKALQSLHVGMHYKDLDQISRDYISDMGYGDSFGHALGHGIGLDAHERPRVSPASTDSVQQGEFITIEPGIYITGKFGVRLENTVYIDQSGPIVFSVNEFGIY